MSNYGPVDKTINHTVFIAGKEYRRYKNDGYYVLYPVVDGSVNYSKGVLEHRLVYEITNGVALSDDMQVHHLNHNRSDNRPENLVALSRSEHTRLHNSERGGGLEPSYCVDCGKQLARPTRKRCRQCYKKYMARHVPSMDELASHTSSMTNAEVAKLYGVSIGTIAGWKRKYGLISTRKQCRTSRTGGGEPDARKTGCEGAVPTPSDTIL